jgi:hypothetical protein
MGQTTLDIGHIPDYLLDNQEDKKNLFEILTSSSKDQLWHHG